MTVAQVLSTARVALPLLVALVAGCAHRTAPAPVASASPAASAPPAVSPAAPPLPRAARKARARIDGRDFPDKLLALTWDDGPDAHTLELARYLSSRHVPASFFVVGAWIRGLSNEPGEGAHIERSGYDAIPILDELVALGHRVENHTRHHVLLAEAPAPRVVAELVENQRAIAKYQRGSVALFRAPGGAFGDASSAALDADPEGAALVGPVHWDLDGKDWEGSLNCPSDKPSAECEAEAPGREMRVKPEVVAARYVALAEGAGHGIVLFHDRVGHVGSDFALRVAKIVIPALVARGFVFGPPVLRFGPLVVTTVADSVDAGAPAEPASGDLNGDGREDRCARAGGDIVCALASAGGFLRSTVWLSGAPVDGRFELRDANGDGRADACFVGAEGTTCAYAP